MSTITKNRKPVNVSRAVRILAPLDAEGKNGEIEITMTRGKKTEVSSYWIDRIPADFGTAFLVEKQGNGIEENEEYHVNLDGPQSLCDCKGFSRWGHCKHADSLKKLTELNHL